MTRSDALTVDWYALPVLFVADIDRTLDFYVNRLGFTQSWRYEEEGQALVAQAELVIRDPDGNELYFNYPSNDEALPCRKSTICDGLSPST
jgi:catechol 2,3-dioxygenase-like lactoylglutathione lyase family enzyme